MSKQDDGSPKPVKFTPPTFERWLGRLQMLRTGAAMGAFALVWLMGTNNGLGWEVAAVRGIIAAIIFHFFAWAAGLFIFAELHEADIRRRRQALENRERERAQRIEELYMQRMQQESELAAQATAARAANRYSSPPAIGGPIGGAGSSSGGGFADQSQRFAA